MDLKDLWRHEEAIVVQTRDVDDLVRPLGGGEGDKGVLAQHSVRKRKGASFL